MIRSFQHKGLAGLFLRNNPSKLRPDLVDRLRVRLSVLDEAERLQDLNVPGFDFHKLRGKPVRYSMHVNGPFCLTFEWDEGEAWRVDLINYH